MAKKSKEKAMDLFYLDMDEKEKKKGKKKKNKELEKETKDNVIDFDNEIIIGVTEIPDNKPKSKENKKPKKQKKMATASNDYEPELYLKFGLLEANAFEGGA